VVLDFFGRAEAPEVVPALVKPGEALSDQDDHVYGETGHKIDRYESDDGHHHAGAQPEWLYRYMVHGPPKTPDHDCHHHRNLDHSVVSGGDGVQILHVLTHFVQNPLQCEKKRSHVLVPLLCPIVP